MVHKKDAYAQLKEVFGLNISKIRYKLEESQEKFACRFDDPNGTEITSGRTVRKWESAQALPRVDKLLNLAHSLGVSIESLFEGEQILDPFLFEYLFLYLYNYIRLLLIISYYKRINNLAEKAGSKTFCDNSHSRLVKINNLLKRQVLRLVFNLTFVVFILINSLTEKAGSKTKSQVSPILWALINNLT